MISTRKRRRLKVDNGTAPRLAAPDYTIEVNATVPDFQDEAVQLVETSGRSRRANAEDFGVGLSTLRHWIDRRPESRQEDMAAELKRLRRENEIPRRG